MRLINNTALYVCYCRADVKKKTTDDAAFDHDDGRMICASFRVIAKCNAAINSDQLTLLTSKPGYHISRVLHLCSEPTVIKKVKQSHYRPGVAQRVLGS